MDPLTICTAVASLVKTCGTAATTCNGLLGKYKKAPEILASIRTECTTIKTTLSYVDWLVRRDTELLSSQLKAHSPLADTFDVALTGCAFTFSLLDIELRKLYDRSKDHDGYKWKDKMRYVWDEDRAKSILDQMRGLQNAVNLVLTALQTSSISALVPLLQDQKPIIERVRNDTKSIRESLSLQLDLTADADRQALSKNYSISNSSIGDEDFSFDDEIINSFAYRNAIKRLTSKVKATQQNTKPDERPILDEPLIDLEGLSQTHGELDIKSTAILNPHCLTSNMPSTHTALLSNTVMEDFKSLLPISNGSPSQQTTERYAAMSSSSSISGSSNDAPANLGDNNRDVEKVTGQHVQDDEYREMKNSRKLPRKPVQALAEPLQPSSQSTSIAADGVKQFDEHVTFPMNMSDKSCCSDDTRSSISSKESKMPLPWRERRRKNLAVKQVARGQSHSVFPSPPRTLARSGNLDTYHSNIALVDFGHIQVKAQCDYATDSLQRRKGRPTRRGQYDHIGDTKASKDGEIPDSSLVVGTCDTNPEPHEKDETSTGKATYKGKNPSRRTRRRSNGQSSSAAEGYAAPLTAAALKHHERGYSLSDRDAEPSISRQKHSKRRVQDNNQDSGHAVSLLDNAKSRGDEGVASKSSMNSDPRLLETFEKTIKKLIAPELEAIKREQNSRKINQLPKFSPRALIASPATRADMSHRSSKHTRVSDTSENLEALRSRDLNNTDICEPTDRTWYSIPEDGSPVVIPIKKHRKSHNKGREDTSTHTPKDSHTSLLFEYFEGGKGRTEYSRPGVRVKAIPLTARKIKDGNEHVQVEASKDSCRPFHRRQILLGPRFLEDEWATTG